MPSTPAVEKAKRKQALEWRLRHKYTVVGCPALRYEDVCWHPEQCAEQGGCLGLNLERSKDDD